MSLHVRRGHDGCSHLHVPKRRPFIVATVGIQSWGKAEPDIPPSEGVAPSEAGKAAEVGVVGVNLGLVLHGYGGYVRVGHQVRADAGRDEISPEVDQVAGPGVDRDHVGEQEPLPDAVHRFRRGCRLDQHPGVRHQPHEAGRHHPGNAHSLRAVDQAFPPESCRIVIRRSVVVGIYQQVQVRDYQAAPGTEKESVSSWSLI